MAKRIPLTKGQFAIVDDDVFDRLMTYRLRWCFVSGYAFNRTLGLMHRFISGVEPGLQVDHRNGNKLDNRKENLRFATVTQNAQNKAKVQHVWSKFKGAHWDGHNNRWLARIRVDGKLKYLGSFDTDLEAAQAYNEAATRYFGEFAKLNEIHAVDASSTVRVRVRKPFKRGKFHG